MCISDGSSDVGSSDLVAVQKMSARVTASSMVTTSNPSIAACSAQIGSTSVTSTRAPPLRSEAAEPLPTSPKPATHATLPASITSVARRIASTRLSLQPYRLSRSEEHTSELQSLMRISYAVFCLKKKKTHK